MALMNYLAIINTNIRLLVLELNTELNSIDYGTTSVEKSTKSLFRSLHHPSH